MDVFKIFLYVAAGTLFAIAFVVAFFIPKVSQKELDFEYRRKKIYGFAAGSFALGLAGLFLLISAILI